MGIKETTPIAKRIINKDLDNPEDRAFVATQLLTHAANGKVTSEVKKNIKNFLAGVQNGNLRDKTRDETSTEINTGTLDSFVFLKASGSSGIPAAYVKALPTGN